MIDHVGLHTQQFDTMLAFYQAALAPLGYTVMMQFEGNAGLGRETPDLWISAAEGTPSRVHLALGADKHEAVDAFHAAALAAGGKDNGGPGLRPHYTPTYYAAFVIDPDGNNVEVVCHNG
ncbi:glyoxalase [Devosia epidermidihirudinis]|uniref:Glyoxalase n=1 Tax=Devosia epidermidihirudinis TaxID=1293439 RepID=A0A0F5Q6S8_9HYPH|nr:VOC family protein [Devosia epidermidihirudinis]KKC36647.1 glyoxalase [Devosia epidermidihirudinis]